MEPRIIGGYTLHALLGRGATSEVYAASHQVHGDRLALKLLTEPLSAEVGNALGVDHPNVVRVIDTGRDYVVMERIDGEDLATRLARLGRLDEATVRTMFAAIADGMQAVHAHDLVHRDLKPANVMLAGDTPKIVDFGIAKYLGERSAVATARRVGSPAYMAPEQLTGGLVAPCVDVWALGVMMFEAVMGVLPFNGFADGRAPQLFETAPHATAVSPPLARLIARCLEREPGRRPPTMAAIAAELRGEVAPSDERVTQDVAPPVAPPGASIVRGAAAVSDRGSRWQLVLLAGLAVAAMIVVVVIVWPKGSPAAAGTASQTQPSPAARTAPPAQPAPAQPTPTAPEPAPVPPTPSPFFVDVRSTPAGAAVFVDGKPRGKTPAHLELAAPASITVRRNGYRTSRLRAEHAGTLQVQLAPLPNPTHDRPHGETLD